MNILFVSDVSIHKVIGGAERVLFEQSIRLAQTGHRVYILTRRLSSHVSDYENIQNVHEFRYEIDQTNSLSFLISSLFNCQKLYKTISKKETIALINFHQPFSALAVNLLRGSQKIPKIYTCHSLSSEEYQIRNKNCNFLQKPFFLLNTLFRNSIEKFSLSKCNKIIVLSQFTKDKLIKNHAISAQQIEIIPGAADIDYFRPAMNKKDVRKELNISENKFVLLTVRNLVARMGLENLIKAIALLPMGHDNIELIIGGEGILKEDLRTLIKKLNLEKRVFLCGFLSKDSLLKHYQLADLFILPTVALEGFGLVTVEAMACGTPVLGTPIGGTKEILNSFDKSFLFKNTSAESIAELILEKYLSYKNDIEEYKKLSQKCRTFTEKNYSWEINIQKTERLFIQCVESAEN